MPDRDRDFLAFATRRCQAVDVLAAAASNPLYTARTTPGGSHGPHGTIWDSDTRAVRFWPGWDRTGTPVATVTWSRVAAVIAAGTTAEDLDQLPDEYRHYCATGNHNRLSQLTGQVLTRALAATPHQEALF